MRRFLDIAKERFAVLAEQEVAITTDRGCREDEFVYLKRGTKKIEVGYEPYAVPYCFVKTDDGGFSEIRKEVVFTAGLSLAGGSKSETLFIRHEEELRDYLDWLVPEIREELRT